MTSVVIDPITMCVYTDSQISTIVGGVRQAKHFGYNKFLIPKSPDQTVVGAGNVCELKRINKKWLATGRFPKSKKSTFAVVTPCGEDGFWLEGVTGGGVIGKEFYRDAVFFGSGSTYIENYFNKFDRKTPNRAWRAIKFASALDGWSGGDVYYLPLYRNMDIC